MNLVFFKIASNLIFHKEKLKIQTPLIYLAFGLVIIPSLLSLRSYLTYEEVENPLEIVVTQPNVDPYNDKFSTDINEVRAHLDLF